MSQIQPDPEVLISNAWIQSGHRSSGWYGIRVAVIEETIMPSVLTLHDEIEADHWLMETIRVAWEAGWKNIAYIDTGVFRIQMDGSFQLVAVKDIITTTPRPELVNLLEEVTFNLRLTQEGKP